MDAIFKSKGLGSENHIGKHFKMNSRLFVILYFHKPPQYIKVAGKGITAYLYPLGRFIYLFCINLIDSFLCVTDVICKGFHFCKSYDHDFKKMNKTAEQIFTISRFKWIKCWRQFIVVLLNWWQNNFMRCLLKDHGLSSDSEIQQLIFW